MEEGKPITGLAWVSGQSVCPKGYSMIVASNEGASGNFVKGFNQKSAVYLSFSTTPENLDQVVTDIVLVNDKTSLPVGYAYISEYIDPKITVSKKKKLCVKMLPLQTADTVVSELKLTVKNTKVGMPYHRIGDMSGLALWCKKVSPTMFRPTPKPRNISSGISALSLNQGDASQTTSSNLTPNPPLESTAPKTSGKAPLSENKIYESSNLYGVSAIDGIPFTIHPMFENKISNPAMTAMMGSPATKDLRIKTLADIENEYNYGFVIERSASIR